MDDIIEISELDWNTPTQKSSNFGSGIELLMNDKAKEGSKKMSSDITFFLVYNPVMKILMINHNHLVLVLVP